MSGSLSRRNMIQPFSRGFGCTAYKACTDDIDHEASLAAPALNVLGICTKGLPSHGQDPLTGVHLPFVCYTSPSPLLDSPLPLSGLSSKCPAYPLCTTAFWTITREFAVAGQILDRLYASFIITPGINAPGDDSLQKTESPPSSVADVASGAPSAHQGRRCCAGTGPGACLH